MEEHLKSTIEFKVAGIREPLVFSSLRGLKEWVDNEAEFWEFLSDIDTQSKILRGVKNAPISKVKQLRAHVDAAIAASDEGPYNDAMSQANAFLTDYTNGSNLYSKTSDAKYVQSLFTRAETQKEIDRALAVLRAFLNEPFDPKQPPFTNDFSTLFRES